jgi:hypothetical protein
MTTSFEIPMGTDCAPLIANYCISIYNQVYKDPSEHTLVCLSNNNSQEKCISNMSNTSRGMFGFRFR